MLKSQIDINSHLLRSQSDINNHMLRSHHAKALT